MIASDHVQHVCPLQALMPGFFLLSRARKRIPALVSVVIK